MKKYYSSPEFEFLKVELMEEVLSTSPTESIPSTMETQDPGPIEDIEF